MIIQMRDLADIFSKINQVSLAIQDTGNNF